MKKHITILLIIIIIFLSSCGCTYAPYEFIFDMGTIIEDFCFALSNDDFELAKTYLHADSPLNDSLIDTINEIEKENSIDFSDGVFLIHRGGGSGSPFLYNGAEYKLEYYFSISKTNIWFYFVVINDENGFGIYDMTNDRIRH